MNIHRNWYLKTRSLLAGLLLLASGAALEAAPTAGTPYFMIVNKYSGKVLDLIAGNTANGARINQWTYDENGPNQRWAIQPTEGNAHFKLVSWVSGKVACIEGDSMDNGAQLHNWDYVGNNPGQQWDFVDAGNGWFKIRNVKSGKLLDVAAWATGDDAKLHQWTDGGAQDNQLWRLQPWGDYMIRAASGRYLCVQGMGNSNGSRIIQYDKQDNPWFKWHFTSEGDGWYGCFSLNALGKALSVEGSSYTNGHWCHLWDYNPSNIGDQKVRLVPQLDGTFKFYFAHDGQTWDIPGGQTGNDVPLEQYPDNGNVWQKFSLERVGAAPNLPGSVNNFYNVILQDGADPYIYKHSDGYYYYTMTTGGNVSLWRSTSITGIGAVDQKVIWTPTPGTGYSGNVWAPEIHYLDGKWYAYFAADDGNNANHRMYVIENASPDPFAGTWTFKGKIAAPTDRWAIDGTVLSVGGSRYFIWSGWETFDNSRQVLYIAAMSNPWTISSERVMISSPNYGWETNTSPQVNEGPEIIIRNGTINLVYSASGSWTDGYCLGLLTASTSANLLSPSSWVKRSSPVFQSGNGVFGPGHASFTRSKDGSEDWIIYHSARWSGGGWARQVRAQRFSWNGDDTPYFGSPANPNVSLTLPSGEVYHLRVEAEAASLFDGARAVSEGRASGGVKVGYIDATTSYVDFPVTVPTAGMYVLNLRCDNGTSGWSVDSLSVNGGPSSDFGVVNGAWDFWGMASVRVGLNAGTNRVRFTKKTGYAEIDCLDIFPYVP